MIHRFKTFEEAEKALWNFHPDEAYYRMVFQFLKAGRQLLRFKPKPGIQKFRTIEEAQKALMEELSEQRQG